MNVMDDSAAPQTPPSPSAMPGPGPMGLAPMDPNDFGENNRDLEKKWPEGAAALKRMVYEYESEIAVSRRAKLKNVRQAREFWRGSQFIFYDELEQRWKVPSLDDTSAKTDTLPRYRFVTNIYQSYGQILVSFLSQGDPKTMWLPEDPDQPEDLATARAATKIAMLFRRNNAISERLIEILYYLCNDGTAFGYVHYVADAEEYGTEQIEKFTSGFGPMGPATANCPTCFEQSEAPAPGGGACPTCQFPIPPENVSPAPMGIVPKSAGWETIAKGQERLDIYSALEVVTPVYAKNRKAFPFLTLTEQIHRSKLRSTYPWIRDKITDGSSDAAETTARATEKNTALMLLLSTSQNSRLGTDMQSALVSYRRTWLRPWAFELIKDKEIRERLGVVFPSGAMVAFAGDTYCESRDESMDDHWREVHALPGEGQNRESLLASMIPVQQRKNTVDNLIVETIEFGVPSMFIDNQVVDVPAYLEMGANPGLTFEAEMRSGRSLADGFFQTRPAELSPLAMQLSHELANETAQQQTGAYPALAGGDTGSNDTARGIGEQRDQALGRIGMFWRQIVSFLAQCDELAVKCFVENRTSDVSMAVLGPAGDIDSDIIHIADIQGSVRAHADPSEAYPASFDKIRSSLFAMAESANPAVMNLIGQPGNLATFLRYAGDNGEIVVPGANARAREFRTIRMLTSGEFPPIMGMPPMGPDGMPAAGPDGMPMQAQPLPGIPFDPEFEDPTVTVQTIREWYDSDAGQECKKSNQMGFVNVKARLTQAIQALTAQQQASAPADPTADPEAGGKSNDKGPAGAPPAN